MKSVIGAGLGLCGDSWRPVRASIESSGIRSVAADRGETLSHRDIVHLHIVQDIARLRERAAPANTSLGAAPIAEAVSRA